MSSPGVQELHTEAQRLINAGKLGAAEQCCTEILRRDPGHADARFLLGIIAAASGRFGGAVDLIREAIERDTRRPEYYAHLARCLSMLKRDSQALAAAHQAAALGPRDALTLDTIGVVYSRAGEHDRAAQVFGRAAAAQPRNAGYQFNLGSSLQILGRFDAAEAAYEAAIRVSPRFYRAHSALSHLCRQTAERNHIPRLEELLAGVERPGDELLLRHALAKEYEDLGEYDRAFAQLAAGNARRRGELDYNSDRDRELFEAVERLFPASRFEDGAGGCDSVEPIFIVGMPRTGTTLTERILSGHSQVESAGELQNLGIAIKRAAGTRSNRVLDVETLERGVETDFGALGRAYIDSTRPATGRSTRFIDKMPLNFFYIGFIHLALPQAKIICLRRNPLDTCLSNFRQLFALNFSYYNYAYDLLDTGRYYLMFDRLLAHWHEVLPGAVLELHYEDLVADPEGQSRRMVEYCGLAWEPQCLAFDRNAAPVATASSAQVRQPLYRDALDRWRHYEQHLEPLKALFARAGLTV